MFRVFAAAALWSTIGIAAVFGGDYIWLAFFRSTAAAAVAAALGGRPTTRSVAPGLLLAGLFTVYPIAAVYAGLGPAAYLLYTAPLWTAAALYAFGEKPRRREAAAVAIVVAAVLVMLAASAAGEISPVGLAAGLASGALYGLYIAAARRLSQTGREIEASLGALTFTPLVVAPIAAAYYLHQGAAPALQSLVAGLYLAVFCTVLPYYLFATAVKKTRGTKAAVVASIEPVLAALWGALLFGQLPGLYTLAAYGLITAAVLLTAAGRN